MFLSAVSHFSHPVTEIPLPLFRVHEDELRALHEIGAKTLGPTFGDVVERVVAASAILKVVERPHETLLGVGLSN